MSGVLMDQTTADLAGDAERLLAEIDRAVPGASSVRGECRPALDVLETTQAIEIVADVAGTSPAAVRVAVRRNAVIIVGVKLPPPIEGAARVHVAERSYGHFARVVRLSSAVDSSRARAVTRAGQLSIVLPRIEERRGKLFVVPVEHAG